MDKQQAIKNLDNVITKIEGARLSVDDHRIVKLIAVSKYSTAKDVKTLYEAGQRAFGENKVQDLKDKMAELEDLPIEWHFIGRLQKNKINNLIDLNPSLVHSIDSFELAQELNNKLQLRDKKMNCLLQVNSAYEDTKAGVNPTNAKEIFEKIKNECPNIILKGVMSIGAHTDDEKDIIESFTTTQNIAKELNIPIVSMGMSSDFELAIKHGSNMVRVGSALFKS